MASEKRGWFMSQREAVMIANPGEVSFLTNTKPDGTTIKIGPFADREEADWFQRNPGEFIMSLIADGRREFHITLAAGPVSEDIKP
jgi:hypothetical protein